MNTKVIFRKFHPERGGELIAIFPELCGDTNPYRTCLSYQHLGQHSACSIDFSKFTFPLTHLYEYVELYDELKSIGYDDLEVVTRLSKKMLQARIAQVS